MSKNWWQMLIDLFFRKPKKVDPVKPKPKPDKPQPISSLPDQIHVGEGWCRWAELNESCKITEFSMSPSGFRATYTEQTNIWPSRDNQTNGWICMAWVHNGEMQAEYWDGKAVCALSPYLYVSLFHITDPTSPFNGRLPAKGQKVAMFFVSENRKQRSQLAWVDWPL